MNILELAKAAIDSINATPDEIEPSLTLCFPEKQGNKSKRYLAGAKSPQGSIVRETHEGIWVIFGATDILAWCAANGAPVIIETNPPNKSLNAELPTTANSEGTTLAA